MQHLKRHDNHGVSRYTRTLAALANDWRRELADAARDGLLDARRPTAVTR